MSLEPTGYRPRLLDRVLERKLKAFGAIEVTGTKFCGKTWTSLAHGESIAHIDDAPIRRMAELDASLVLEGARPHVVDEWQDVPGIWDAVRRRVDEEGNARGQFILTGSSTTDMRLVSHSGAGRIARLHMRPMSLLESGLSDGSVSLAGLFEGTFERHQVEADVRQLARAICQGGWPASLGMEQDLVGEVPSQYLDALFEVSATRRGLDPSLARRVAISLARNTGHAPTYRTLYADACEGEEAAGVDPSVFRQAIEPYVAFFREQHFVEDLLGWDAPVKSRSRVRTKPRRSFVDPSLPAALLGMTPSRLLLETQLFGSLFEELCLRDLRVYASALGLTPEPQVRYYSDADGLEADAVIELPDGRWAAFEVKLSEEKVPEAEKGLLRLRNKVAANPAARNPEPAFLAVIVGKASYAWRTPKGVYVVPVTTLGA